jgi:hypothetical protein
VSVLNAGKANSTNNNEKIKAMRVSKNDSDKNCRIRSFLCEPIAFLTPTSFALFSERAVVRL